MQTVWHFSGSVPTKSILRTIIVRQTAKGCFKIVWRSIFSPRKLPPAVSTESALSPSCTLKTPQDSRTKSALIRERFSSKYRYKVSEENIHHFTQKLLLEILIRYFLTLFVEFSYTTTCVLYSRKPLSINARTEGILSPGRILFNAKANEDLLLHHQDAKINSNVKIV